MVGKANNIIQAAKDFQFESMTADENKIIIQN